MRLKGYQANAVKGKRFVCLHARSYWSKANTSRILIIVDLEVVEGTGELEKIGEPVALTVKDEEDSKPTNTTIAGNGFYGNKPPPAPVQERALATRGAPPSSSSHANIYPIEGLSPYAHKWTIKARVTSKSDIKTWSKPSGEGKLFTVNLLDESGEIRATLFNEQADAYYDILQEGLVYYISTPCRVGFAKKQFSNLANDYELTFERDTQVEKCEDQQNVPQVRYNFTTIETLQEIEKDSTIDVIGILKEVGQVDTIVSKTTQKPYEKRDLTLVDDTGYSVRLTIWGKTANSFDANPESVVAFKGAKVGDFGGRNLSLLSSGSMSVDPDIPEAHKMKGWYDAQGRNAQFNTHQSLAGAGAAGGRSNEAKTLGAVQDEGLGMGEKPDYFTSRGTIVYIKQDTFSYPACSNEGCNKKVEQMTDGTWHCAKCEVNHQAPDHRYIISLNVNDHTAHMWMTAFDDVGRQIMGMSANELMELREHGEQGAAEKVFEAANCKIMNFTCRAKMDTFGEQQRYVILH